MFQYPIYPDGMYCRKDFVECLCASAFCSLLQQMYTRHAEGSSNHL